MDHRRYEIGIDHQDIALLVAVGVMSFVLTVAALWIALR
jgi:hypothetical protein